MSPLSDWLDISVVQLRKQLLLALLFGEVLPFLAVLYLVSAFIWPGTVANRPGWKVVLVVLLCGVALLMVAGALIVIGVGGRISTLSRTLRAVNLPEVGLPEDDELTAVARRLNALLKQQREKEMQVQRLEYALRRARDESSKPVGPSVGHRPGLAGPYVGKAAFDLLIGLEAARASRYHRTFSLATVSVCPAEASVPDEVAEKAVKWAVGSLPQYTRSEVGYRRSDSEVTFLLPETDQRQSVKFAHRLCSSVEAHPFVSGGRLGGVRVRAYCGLATYPVDASEPDRLVEITADRHDEARKTGCGVVGNV
jgi:hypothetical protein